MRRFISTLLALLVLLLSCLPCNDAMAEGTGIAVTTVHDCHEADHQDIDSCSPFCACTCCAGFVLPVYQPVFQANEQLHFLKPRAAHQQKALSDAFLPIWQPPQLV